MEGGRDQNYWPGFVDALSNVVLTLVFVLVIFVFALVMATSKVEESMEMRIRKEMAEHVAASEKGIDSESSTVSEGHGEDGISQIKIESKPAEKMKAGVVKIGRSISGVILNFPLSVVEMDEKSSGQLLEDLENKKESIGDKHKIKMFSIVGREAYSVAHRFAYYRAISVRNLLIEKLGESPENITVSIVTPPQPEDGRVEIVFQKK